MNNKLKERLPLFFLAIILAVSSFFAGTVIDVGGENDIDKISALANKEEGMPNNVDFSPFWKVWNILEEKHIGSEEINTEERVWGAIKGLADSFGDSNTVFMPPRESEMFEVDIQGHFEGVGMQVGIRNGELTVIAPLKGTPADEAGIESGDIIISIDEEDAFEMSLNEAVYNIRGEKGSTVTLNVFREGVDKPFDISVIRDVIDIPTIDTTLRNDGIFVIELYNFTGQVTSLFREALDEFNASGSDKLILDLRGNPGGFLQASIDLAGYFLPAGEVVVVEVFGDGRDDKIYRSRGDKLISVNDIDMAILIDQGSASASEILAGALREHEVATLIGRTTFGKGSVQELVRVTSDTSVKVTIAKWQTPDGHIIEEQGISPDIEIEFTAEDREDDRDSQLNGAIEFLLGR